MKLGSPGDPLATHPKSRPKFVPEDLQFESSAHDMCIKPHLIPSLMGKILWDVSNSYALGKYCNVEVNMILKEGSIYPSNLFRHDAKLIIKIKYCKE